MKNIKCYIKSKVGIIYSRDDEEITTLDETFPYINRNKYIGLCIQTKITNNSEMMHIAHYSLVKKLFEKYQYLIDKNRQYLEETANWMLAYEAIIFEINIDILGKDIVNNSLYSMDLARYLEQTNDKYNKNIR